MSAITKGNIIGEYELLQQPEVSLPMSLDMRLYQVARLVEWELIRDENDVAFFLSAETKAEVGISILIPPVTNTTISELMTLIEANGFEGENCIVQDLIMPSTNVDQPEVIPSVLPYAITDVEDGRLNRCWQDRREAPQNKPYPVASAINNTKRGRFMYDVIEGIIHVALFPHILNDKALVLARSRYGAREDYENFSPILFLDSGEPVLQIIDISFSFLRGAVPSYRKRIFPK